MDDHTLRELERLRDEALELCDKTRKVAESVVALIDEATRGHRKPRRHLTVVKGLITGAAGYIALRKLLGVAAASAVTAAAVSVLIVPAVVAPHGQPAVRQPAVSHVKRRPAVQRSRRPAPGVSAPAAAVSSAPVPSPSPSVLPLPSLPLPSASPTCVVNLLGVCIPLGDVDHDGDLA